MAPPTPTSMSMSISNTVPIHTSTPLASQQVSWQSAFLGLVPIALNTCLQEPGLVLNIDADHAVPLRSSPFVCLFDSILVWLQLAYWTRKHGIAKATRIVQKGRKLENTNSGITIQSFFAMILLVALAVVQATKLFGFRGIPWTQAFAAAFLLNYFTNLVLGHFSQRGEYQSLEDRGSGRGEFRGCPSWPSSRIFDAFVIIAFLSQVGAWVFACERVWSAAHNIEHGTAGFWLAIVVGFLPAWYLGMVVIQGWVLVTIFVDAVILLVPIAIVLGLIYVCWRFLKALTYRTARYINWNAKRLGYCIGISLAIGMAFIWARFVGFGPYRKVLEAAAAFSTVFFAYDVNATTLDWLFAPCFLLGLFGWYLVVSYIFVALYASTVQNSFRDVKIRSDRFHWFVLSANFALSFLYFRYAYKQDGTFKPSWTGNLG